MQVTIVGHGLAAIHTKTDISNSIQNNGNIERNAYRVISISMNKIVTGIVYRHP